MNDNAPRPHAFDSLLLAHEPYIRSRIFALEKATAKHEDIYQEVIATALERWSAYRATGNFAGWLYWLVRSVVHRKSCSAAFGPTLPPTEPTQEYATDIALLLDRCTEEVLLHACGHTEAEIARRAGVTPAAAHYRLKAARAVLVAGNDNEPRKAA